MTDVPTNLPGDVRQTLRSYLKDTAQLFGPALEAVLLYGSAASGEFMPERSNINLLIILQKHETALLEKYAAAHKRWSKEHIVVPLFLTRQELRESLDLFPLEYGEIKEHHVLLAGRDPFPELRLDSRNLRVQCEQEIRGNLFRLRQRFVEGGGKQEAVLLLLPLSLTALLPCLKGLLRLLGLSEPRSTDALLGDLQSQFGLDPSAFQEVLNLKRGLVTPGPLEVPRLFERYLAALTSLLQRIEQLKMEGRL
jgi:predicted nucleotidyltransferase